MEPSSDMEEAPSPLEASRDMKNSCHEDGEAENEPQREEEDEDGVEFEFEVEEDESEDSSDESAAGDVPSCLSLSGSSSSGSSSVPRQRLPRESERAEGKGGWCLFTSLVSRALVSMMILAC
jgi:hypothetical protein